MPLRQGCESKTVTQPSDGSPSPIKLPHRDRQLMKSDQIRSDSGVISQSVISDTRMQPNLIDSDGKSDKEIKGEAIDFERLQIEQNKLHTVGRVEEGTAGREYVNASYFPQSAQGPRASKLG